MLGEVCQPDSQELFHKFLMAQGDMNRGGNRRKQSKPNRLRAEEEANLRNALNLQNQISQELEKQQNNEHAEEVMDVGGVEPDDQEKVIHQEPNASTEKVQFPCHSCSEVFLTRNEQERHMSEHHASEKNEDGSSVFPTAYHRLASDLTLQPAAIAKMLAGTKVSSPTDGSPNGRGGTVFQREAYCEICQREFCNKYFLKTHKANIHGIVDPNDPKFSPTNLQRQQQMKKEAEMAKQAAAMTSVMKPSADSMEDFCEICQKHFCNKYYLKKHKLDVHNIRPDGNRQPGSRGNETPERQSLPPIPTSLPHLPMMVPNGLNANQMNNMLFVNPFMPNMGMVSPAFMQHPLFMQSTLSGLAGLPGLTNNLLPGMKEEEKVKQLSPTSPKEMIEPDGVGEVTFCNMCKKEFCNSYYLKIHRANKHGLFDDDMRTPQSKASSVSPRTPGPPLNPINVTSPSEETPRKVSPSFPQPPTGMKQNLTFDAMVAAKLADRITCDICNKEVCNKYFLKQHKQKMHGILYDKLNGTQIQGEMTTESYGTHEERKGSPVRPSPTSDSMFQLKASPTSETFCSLCKKDCGTNLGLRGHLITVHGSRIEGFGDSTEQMGSAFGAVNELMKWKEQMNSQTNTSNASQAMNQWKWKENSSSMRVFCDICNKELCNKYFLKTHKRKLHGIIDDTSKSDSSLMMASNMMADLARVSQAHMKNGMPERPGLQDKMSYNRPSSVTSGSPGPLEKMEGMRDEACHVCGMVFDDVNAVREHLSRDHRMDIRSPQISANDGDSYTCSHCPFSTTVLATLYRHECRYHHVPVTQCKLCPESFDNVQQTVNHVYSTHKRALSAKTLMRVDRKHNIKLRKIKCPQCNEKFLDKQLCLSHLRSVHNIKSTPLSTLNQQKLFACDKCNYTDISRNKLRKHQMLKHRTTSPNYKQTEMISKQSDQTRAEVTLQQFEVIGLSADVLAMSRITLPVFKPVMNNVNVTLTPRSPNN